MTIAVADVEATRRTAMKFTGFSIARISRAIRDEMRTRESGRALLSMSDRLLADMQARGVDVAEPSDPLHDHDFIRALISTYSIAPVKDWATAAA